MKPNERLISNPVFQSLQPPTKVVDTKSGTILFANKFSGIQEIAMPEDLKEILDSDFATVGNNPLVQLNNKMSAYPGGPWYIDSKNGLIYIHNRKFNEDPVYEYSYQSDNGELINANFTTQNVTRDMSGSVSQVVNPINKGYSSESSIVLSTNLSEPKFEVKDTDTIHSSHSTSVYKPNIVGPIKFDSTNSDEESKAYATYKSGELKSSRDKSASSAFHDMGNEELAKHTNTYLNSKFPTAAQREQFKRDAEEAKKKGNIEQFWKSTFEGDTYIVNQGHETWFEEWANPYYYQTYGKLVDPYMFSGSGVLYKGGIDKNLRAALKKLDSLPNVKVIENSLVVKSSGDRPSMANCKVRILRKRKASYRVSGYHLIHRTSSRLKSNTDSQSANSSNRTSSGNSLSNLNGKVVERKLTVQALVVGNPILESSQIIVLKNLGSKWSGPYYIKSCSHRLTPREGYTCSLELIQNTTKAGSSVASNSVATQKGNNHPDSKVPDSVNISITQTELDWFATKSTAVEKADAVLMAMYARYSAKSPAELEKVNTQGIVKASGTYNSSGKYEVTYTLRKPIKVSFKFKHTYYQTVLDYIKSRETDNSN